MSRCYVFADEAGDFEFARKPNVSKHFIVCTVMLTDCSLGAKLLDLRRDLIWNEHPVGPQFHATEDKRVVRDAVYDMLGKADLQIAATILTKSKAQPQVRATRARFYKYGWYFHFAGLTRRVGLFRSGDEFVITAACVATKKEQATFTAAVNDVVQQYIARGNWATHFCPAMADPCLQIADYCTWAIQRKWEKGETRWYDLLRHRIVHEHDAWAAGTTHYY